MSWVLPTKQGLRAVARYGPQVKAVWEPVADRLRDGLRATADELSHRRRAAEDAEVRVAGSFLRVPHPSGRVYVVFTRDEPVASYPAVAESLYDLIAHADLDRRVTPQQWRERRLRLSR